MAKKFVEPDILNGADFLAESRLPYGLKTHISLFSSAGFLLIQNTNGRINNIVKTSIISIQINRNVAIVFQ